MDTAQSQKCEFEQELELEQRTVAQKFTGEIPISQLEPAASYAFAHLSRAGISPIEGCKTVSRHPLRSPLIELISSISQKGFRVSAYNGFLISANRPLSAFEKGALRVVFKNNPLKLIAPTTLCQGDSLLMPSYHEVGFSDYYSQFRWTSPFQNEFQNCPNPFPVVFNQIYTLLALRVASLFTNERRERSQLPEGHPVACILVSKAGEILFWAVNTNTKDVIRHAEVNALGSYFQYHPEMRFLPEDITLFTSLKSCHMCAGAIVDSVDPEHPVKVKYGQTDPTENHSKIQRMEEKVQHSVILQIDATYPEAKEESKICAALSLKHPKFDSMHIEIKEELEKLLNQYLETLQGKEIQAFLNFFERQ